MAIIMAVNKWLRLSITYEALRKREMHDVADKITQIHAFNGMVLSGQNLQRPASVRELLSIYKGYKCNSKITNWLI